VLERGRIVEDGTHAELMARQGLYQRLYDRKFETPAAPVETEEPIERVLVGGTAATVRRRASADDVLV
jgi:hypothetical protein